MSCNSADLSFLKNNWWWILILAAVYLYLNGELGGCTSD